MLYDFVEDTIERKIFVFVVVQGGKQQQAHTDNLNEPHRVITLSPTDPRSERVLSGTVPHLGRGGQCLFPTSNHFKSTQLHLSCRYRESSEGQESHVAGNIRAVAANPTPIEINLKEEEANQKQQNVHCWYTIQCVCMCVCVWGGLLRSFMVSSRSLAATA